MKPLVPESGADDLLRRWSWSHWLQHTCTVTITLLFFMAIHYDAFHNLYLRTMHKKSLWDSMVHCPVYIPMHDSVLHCRCVHCWSRRSVCLRRWYLNRHRFTNSEPHTSLCSNQKEGSQFKSTDCVHKTWWSISNLWIVIINLFEHLSLGGICVLARRPIYCFA